MCMIQSHLNIPIVVRSKYILQSIVKLLYSILAMSFTLRGKDNNLDYYCPEQN
jgi:hypothetical protein